MRSATTALNPEHPAMRGSHENGDTFFQHREACNGYYDALPEIVEEYMDKVNAKLGTDYKLFNYYGAPDAERVIIAMGSICDVAEEVIDYLNAHGEKVGLVKVRLYRPFSRRQVCSRPFRPPARRSPFSTARRSPAPWASRCTSTSSPLWPTPAGMTSRSSAAATASAPRIRLPHPSSPSMKSWRRTSRSATSPSASTTMSPTCPCEEHAAPNTAAEGTIECKFWGLGGDGTVGANKNSIKIIGDHTDKYVQAYFQYDSKKTGGVTISHLRFGDKPIKSPYYINKADFVACHNPSYITKGFKIVNDVKPGGVFLINCQWDLAELEHHLNAEAKRYIAKNNIQLYTINAIDLAIKVGMGKRTNTILQSAFFSLAKVMPEADAIKYMKDAAEQVLRSRRAWTLSRRTGTPSTPALPPTSRSMSPPHGPRLRISPTPPCSRASRSS